MQPLAEEIIAAPATSLSGLRAKALVALWEAAVAVWRAALCAEWHEHISASEQAVVILLGADKKANQGMQVNSFS
jgi:hypothetical protein